MAAYDLTVQEAGTSTTIAVTGLPRNILALAPEWSIFVVDRKFASPFWIQHVHTRGMQMRFHVYV